MWYKHINDIVIIFVKNTFSLGHLREHWTLKFSHASATFWIESFENRTQYYRLLLLLLLLYYLVRRCVPIYVQYIQCSTCIMYKHHLINSNGNRNFFLLLFSYNTLLPSASQPPPHCLSPSVSIFFSHHILDCTRVPSFANIHIHIGAYFNFLPFGHQIDTVQYVPFHKFQFSSVLFSFHFVSFFLFIWTTIFHIKMSIPTIMSLWLPKRAEEKIFMLRLFHVLRSFWIFAATVSIRKSSCEENRISISKTKRIR